MVTGQAGRVLVAAAVGAQALRITRLSRDTNKKLRVRLSFIPISSRYASLNAQTILDESLILTQCAWRFKAEFLRTDKIRRGAKKQISKERDSNFPIISVLYNMLNQD
jgi:hypothetical protein